MKKTACLVWAKGAKVKVFGCFSLHWTMEGWICCSKVLRNTWKLQNSFPVVSSTSYQISSKNLE